MAIEQFLKLEGIEGESRDAEHENEIDVLSWSWGMTQSGSAHGGSARGTDRVNVQDLSVVKWVDKATPKLMLHICNGRQIPRAELVVRRAGERPLEYLAIEMEKVIVTSVSTTRDAGGENRETENIGLNFARFKVKYIPQGKDGSPGRPEEIGWDIAKNRRT